MYGSSEEIATDVSDAGMPLKEANRTLVEDGGFSATSIRRHVQPFTIEMVQMENQGAQQYLAAPKAMTNEATAAMRGVVNDTATGTEGAQPELAAHGVATKVDINAMPEAAPDSTTTFGGNTMSDTASDSVTDLGGHAKQFAELPSGQYVKQGPLGNTSNLRITRTN